jgi:hypothetical protein
MPNNSPVVGYNDPSSTNRTQPNSSIIVFSYHLQTCRGPNMTCSLLQLPPELLAQILEDLPVKALLKFGEASHRTNRLVVSNFHNLAFSFHTNRRTPPSNRTVNTFNKKSSSQPHRVNTERSPYEVLIHLDPTYECIILLNLHCALTRSLLLRYSALRTLEMSLWALAAPMAKALARLSGLRELSIRIDETTFISHYHEPIRDIVQQQAWDALAAHAVWAPSVRCLRFANCHIDSVQLIRLLSPGRRLGELGLSACPFVDERVLEFMGCNWRGREGLQTLALAECDDALGGGALEAIDDLSGLQVGELFPVLRDYLT